MCYYANIKRKGDVCTMSRFCKSEINSQIVAETRAKIEKFGLFGKLDVFPIANTFTYRPRYWSEGSMHFFKIHLWDINGLDAIERSKEIDDRISAAREYFGL